MRRSLVSDFDAQPSEARMWALSGLPHGLDACALGSGFYSGGIREPNAASATRSLAGQQFGVKSWT